VIGPRLPLHPRRRSVSPIASPIASRIAKGSFSDATYEAIGTVDELNSVIGFAAQMLTTSSSSSPAHQYDRAGNEPARLEAHEKLATRLETVQAWLLDVGSSLCTPRSTTFNPRKLRRTKGVRHADVVALEGWIDEADAHLARLSSFILPGGSPGASALHVAVPCVAGPSGALGLS